MLCYINRGLIVEQALVALIHDYFDSIHLDQTYSNFHVLVTNDHPFADLYLHDGINASDSFPAVVVTTMTDDNESETYGLPDQMQKIGITEDDLELIIKTTKTRTFPSGKTKEEPIPGLCTVIDEESIDKIRETIESHGMAYGMSIRTYNSDSVSIEIWAENVQLKNEIYKQLIMYCRGNLKNDLDKKYSSYGTAIYTNKIKGQPSNNYNFDFDVALCGAQITLSVNYWQEQILIDTDLTNVNQELIWEVDNNVKTK